MSSFLIVPLPKYFKVLLSFDSLCNIQVSKFDLPLCRTSVGELLPLVGTVQIPPHPCHFCWDLKVTIFLGYNLEKEKHVNSGKNMRLRVL